MTPEEKLLALIQQDKRTEDRDQRSEVRGQPTLQSEVPTPKAINLPPVQPVREKSVAVDVAPAAPIAPVVVPQTQPTLPQPVVPKPIAVIPEVRTPLAPAIPVRGEGVEKPAPVEKKIKLAEGRDQKPEVRNQSSEANTQFATPSGRFNVGEGRSQASASVGPSADAEAGKSGAKPPTSDLGSLTSDAPLLAAGPTFRPSRSIRLVYLNRVLAVVVLVLAAVVFYSVGSTRRGIAGDLERQVNGAGSMSEPPVIVSEDKVGLETYLEKVSSRNIFVPKLAAKTGPEAGPVLPTGILKDLKLVAVSLDSSSSADSMAIIKNKTDAKTYFVKLGQTVGGTDYVLDKVLSDRVVLKQRKQEFELK